MGAIAPREIEAFFVDVALMERARDLIMLLPPVEVVPWGMLIPPQDVQAWRFRQESRATLRAHRKEAERLILWAILEQGRALSSLTVEDADAYRASLRRLPLRAVGLVP